MSRADMRKLGFVYRMCRGDSAQRAAEVVRRTEARLRALPAKAEGAVRSALGCTAAPGCHCPFCVGGAPPAGGAPC